MIPATVLRSIFLSPSLLQLNWALTFSVTTRTLRFQGFLSLADLTWI
jgi:hypothetical protein